MYKTKTDMLLMKALWLVLTFFSCHAHSQTEITDEHKNKPHYFIEAEMNDDGSEIKRLVISKKIPDNKPFKKTTLSNNISSTQPPQIPVVQLNGKKQFYFRNNSTFKITANDLWAGKLTTKEEKLKQNGAFLPAFMKTKLRTVDLSTLSAKEFNSIEPRIEVTKRNHSITGQKIYDYIFSNQPLPSHITKGIDSLPTKYSTFPKESACRGTFSRISMPFILYFHDTRYSHIDVTFDEFNRSKEGADILNGLTDKNIGMWQKIKWLQIPRTEMPQSTLHFTPSSYFNTFVFDSVGMHSGVFYEKTDWVISQNSICEPYAPEAKFIQKIFKMAFPDIEITHQNSKN